MVEPKNDIEIVSGLQNRLLKLKRNIPRPRRRLPHRLDAVMVEVSGK